ncbi:alpha/beta-hydrolase [Eremomyces bilateralis CBS 781.70]|uniref:Alpha/beta-hydrolase n=1 Tax=Eremomyces bilateralis CBS 781.70 TaxID=1392243 RepID=A0A6G1FX97_9PEZI|nr:alpha/beta-hydrolase [Eremomyces bilateralis CBS 781.70]KAF1810368.1 alpha/beta-hydrolase [Eremomyces bilateralis CBS 781.70]
MPGISFFKQNNPPIPLPDTITRSYIPGPAGPLELLYAGPRTPTPLFFCHGGCGSALVWLAFLEFFSQNRNIPCYAVSARGRGQSWDPGYLRLYFTRIREAEKREGEVNGVDTEVALVGHSSVGGLSRFLLADGDVRVRGLALLGAVPGTGSGPAYYNWFWIDPWMYVRMLFHLGHPMSLLSSTRLVKRAFSCDDFPMERVAEFEAQMPASESMLWPWGMALPFLKTANVLTRITRWGT